MIVDSAYPLQSSAGVETIETNSDQMQVIRQVLSAIDNSIHVRPIVYMDAELPFVTEKDAPGVTAYRQAIKTVLAGQKITSLPHEQIIAKVDEVGKTFHIVVLKTTLTVPYTSVFLQLNCKYWSDDAEARLRKAMTPAARSSWAKPSCPRIKESERGLHGVKAEAFPLNSKLEDGFQLNNSRRSVAAQERAVHAGWRTGRADN